MHVLIIVIAFIYTTSLIKSTYSQQSNCNLYREHVNITSSQISKYHMYTDIDNNINPSIHFQYSRKLAYVCNHTSTTITSSLAPNLSSCISPSIPPTPQSPSNASSIAPTVPDCDINCEDCSMNITARMNSEQDCGYKTQPAGGQSSERDCYAGSGRTQPVYGADSNGTILCTWDNSMGPMTGQCVFLPIVNPTLASTHASNISPTQPPSNASSIAPSTALTQPPSNAQSIAPTQPPSIASSNVPSIAPTQAPSIAPSIAPTQPPSLAPSINQLAFWILIAISFAIPMKSLPYITLFSLILAPVFSVDCIGQDTEVDCNLLSPGCGWIDGQCVCTRSAPIDIIFGVDYSASLTDTELGKSKAFLEGLIDGGLGMDTRTGWTLFGSDVDTDDITLLNRTIQDNLDIIGPIGNGRSQYERTNTAGALQSIITEYQTNNDPTRENLAIMVTDGNPCSPHNSCGFSGPFYEVCDCTGPVGPDTCINQPPGFSDTDFAPLIFAEDIRLIVIAVGDDISTTYLSGCVMNMTTDWIAVDDFNSLDDFFGIIQEITCVTTASPSAAPSISPTQSPSNAPSIAPTQQPSLSPSKQPTHFPSNIPTISPSLKPSITPSIIPTNIPSISPTEIPTLNPTRFPSNNPTITPTFNPSVIASTTPTYIPSKYPSINPSHSPTYNPSKLPSLSPSIYPIHNPTITPSQFPTQYPTLNPFTTQPTSAPTIIPSINPSKYPSLTPTKYPTHIPSISPTLNPSFIPTHNPIISPSIAAEPEPTTTAEPVTTEVCPMDRLGDECTYNSECPSCMKCCPYLHVCEMLDAKPKTRAQAIAMMNDMNDKPIVNKPKATNDPNMFGYILLVGLIAFILINNLFIGCWCLYKKNGNKNEQQYEVYENCDIVAINGSE